MDRSLFGNFAFLDRNLDWLFWEPVHVDQWSAWVGLVPVGHWIVRNARPGLIVELGTFSGVSFGAFCNAVRRDKLDCRCVAVDTWAGDAHAGHYPDWIFDDVKKMVEENFAGFATMLRKTFDEALDDIADGSVDLLHIDGLHTYEAVRHDFESWLPKLSRRATVLFHDVAVMEADFGVHRYWNELRQQYAGFAFTHSAGLGVLQVGPDAPAPIKGLCQETDPALQRLIRRRFEFLATRYDLHRACIGMKTDLDALRKAGSQDQPTAS